MALETERFVGERLTEGRYEVRRQLGAGGMAFVYLAYDRHENRQVVIKVPRQAMLEDPEFAGRFQREVKSLIRLNHPHIAKILDVGEHDGKAFVVLEYLSGGSLRDRMKNGPRPVKELQTWLPGIAAALDFCHENECVHRDVKPDNILFDGQGKAYLSDFGIAKVMSKSPKTKMTVLTGAGLVLGTAQYMAPELVMGKKYDGKADQYGLAVTVYEVLAGKTPFTGNTPMAVIVEQSTKEVPPLHSIAKGISRHVSGVVGKGLLKGPNDRFKKCLDFADGVVAAGEKPDTAVHVQGSTDTAKTSPKKKAEDTGKYTPVAKKTQATAVTRKPRTAATTQVEGKGWSLREMTLLGMVVVLLLGCLVTMPVAWIFFKNRGTAGESQKEIASVLPEDPKLPEKVPQATDTDLLAYVAPEAKVIVGFDADKNLEASKRLKKGDLLQEFVKSMGADYDSQMLPGMDEILKDCKRLVFSGGNDGVLVVLTNSPANQKKVMASFQINLADAKYHQGKTYFEIPNVKGSTSVLAFPNERLILLGTVNEVKRILGSGGQKTSLSPDTHSLVKSVEQHFLWSVVPALSGKLKLSDLGVDPNHLPPDLQPGLTAIDRLKCVTAWVEQTGSNNTKVSIALNCASDNDAQLLRSCLEKQTNSWKQSGDAFKILVELKCSYPGFSQNLDGAYATLTFETRGKLAIVSMSISGQTPLPGQFELLTVDPVTVKSGQSSQMRIKLQRSGYVGQVIVFLKETEKIRAAPVVLTGSQVDASLIVTADAGASPWDGQATVLAEGIGMKKQKTTSIKVIRPAVSLSLKPSRLELMPGETKNLVAYLQRDGHREGITVEITGLPTEMGQPKSLVIRGGAIDSATADFSLSAPSGLSARTAYPTVTARLPGNQTIVRTFTLVIMERPVVKNKVPAREFSARISEVTSKKVVFRETAKKGDPAKPAETMELAEKARIVYYRFQKGNPIYEDGTISGGVNNVLFKNIDDKGLL